MQRPARRSIKVVVRKNFVGVVAEKPWQAIRAAARAESDVVRRQPGCRRQADFYDYLRNAAVARHAGRRFAATWTTQLARAATVVKATYRHPYQMHGSMGTSCAVADVQGDRVNDLVVHAVGLSDAQRRRDAARCARRSACASSSRGAQGATGSTAPTPWPTTRRCCRRPSGGRCACSSRARTRWRGRTTASPTSSTSASALDGVGQRSSRGTTSRGSPSLGGRPGYDTPGNVVTGMLAGFEPAPFAPRSPAPAAGRTFQQRQQRGAVLRHRAASGGACGGTGTVKSERVLTHTIRSPFFTGPLRSPSRLQNTFAHESFMDEIAARVKADPVEYRLRHLRDPRLIDVVKAAAKAAAWEARPSPRAGRQARRRAAAAASPACSTKATTATARWWPRSTSIGPAAASRSSGSSAAQDCGPISSPDGMKNQIEGGALQGMSRALGEAVTWDDRKVTSVDWRTYRSLTLGADVPRSRAC